MDTRRREQHMKLKINCKKTAIKINSHMIRKDMKISDLADYLDISCAAVYKWSTGRTKPSLEVLANLSVLFNVPINELIVTEEFMKKSKNVKSIECYDYDEVHRVDIVETDECYEAWLYAKNYGLKTFMLGVPVAQNSKEEFIQIIQFNIKEYLSFYYKDLDKLERPD